jgi:hypothetical protein
MSRKNKVNPDHYKVAGRLTPDDLARERQVQQGNLRETASDHDRAVAKRVEDRSAARQQIDEGDAASDSGETKSTG